MVQKDVAILRRVSFNACRGESTTIQKDVGARRLLPDRSEPRGLEGKPLVCLSICRALQTGAPATHVVQQCTAAALSKCLHGPFASGRPDVAENEPSAQFHVISYS